MTLSEITLIAAVTPKGGIGYMGNIPWDIPQDRALFARTTKGRPVIMGRKTFETCIKRPLPARHNIVVSKKQHNLLLTRREMTFTASIRETLAWVSQTTSQVVFVIGGGSIYHQMMPYATCLIISHLNQSYPADTFFPSIDPARWRTVAKKPYKDFTRVTYRRV